MQQSRGAAEQEMSPVRQAEEARAGDGRETALVGNTLEFERQSSELAMFNTAIYSASSDAVVNVGDPPTLHDSIDNYYDNHHRVPFLIKEETFPVPASLSEDAWCPGKPLRVAYVSWNMAHRAPNLTEVSSHCIHPNAHIVVVCTQENGSHLGVKREQQRWTKYVSCTCLQGKYDLVGRKTLWYIQLLVYVRRMDVASYVRRTEVSSVKTGIVNGLGGNKGGVAVAIVLSMAPLSPQASKDDGGKHGISPKKKLLLHGGTSSTSEEGKNGISEEEEEQGMPRSTRVQTPYITLLFIGAHLAAHQKGVNVRNRDYHSIIRALQVGFRGRHRSFFEKLFLRRNNNNNNNLLDGHLDDDQDDAEEQRVVNDDVDESSNDGGDACNLSVMQLPSTETQPCLNDHRDVTEEFDLAFFGGDLNYRLYGTRKAIEFIIENHKDIRSVLVHNDQLNLERAKGAVFQQFQEGNLLFRPTYKYEIHQDKYNFTQKKDRMPAYCDRVLYKKPKGSCAGKVRIRLYTDVQQVQTSDHRPIVAIFDVETHVYVPTKGMPEANCC